jgi:hypothetical protein
MPYWLIRTNYAPPYMFMVYDFFFSIVIICQIHMGMIGGCILGYVDIKIYSRNIIIYNILTIMLIGILYCWCFCWEIIYTN